jgi:uncharacterized membrane protein
MRASEKHTRSVIKTITWRVIATLTTGGLIFAFTGKFTLALEIGFLEVVLKLLFGYLHERAWSLAPWGRKRHPLELLPVEQDLAPADLEIIRQRLEELGYL